MDEDGFCRSLRNSRVLIWGLGLMGGSLGLALKDRCSERLGVDPSSVAVRQALEIGVVDRASENARDLLPEADIVVCAAPVRAILGQIEDLPSLHPGQAVVIDLGSTKVEICTALDRLPDRFAPLGGHPMCGKEKSGLAYADGGLFSGAPFALVKREKTSSAAARVAEELVREVGAAPIWLEAEDHDRWVAATSHVPYLISSALAAATPPETLPMLGPGFKSTVRLAGSSPAMMLDILATNRRNVLDALAQVRVALEELDRLLEQNRFDELSLKLKEIQLKYEKLILHGGAGKG